MTCPLLSVLLHSRHGAPRVGTAVITHYIQDNRAGRRFLTKFLISAAHLTDPVFLVVQASQLIVTNARNINQERGTKQSLQSPKQSSKVCWLSMSQPLLSLVSIVAPDCITCTSILHR